MVASRATLGAVGRQVLRKGHEGIGGAGADPAEVGVVVAPAPADDRPDGLGQPPDGRDLREFQGQGDGGAEVGRMDRPAELIDEFDWTSGPAGQCCSVRWRTSPSRSGTETEIEQK